MAWVTDENNNLTEDSGKKILLHEDLELVKKLLLNDEIQFKQSDGTNISLRSFKDQGYDFGIWNEAENKYRFFINNDGRVGVGTNAPYALITAIQDTPTDTQFAGAFVNISDSGKGLSVLAGNSTVPNTVFTSKTGTDVVWVMGDGDVKSNKCFSASLPSTAVGVEKFKLTNSDLSRISILNINEETGSDNEGSDLVISTYADNGTKLHDTLFIKRSSGYVGVGTNNPLYNLDITGDTNINGTLYVNGTPVDLIGSNIANLEDILNVTITDPQSGEVLTWNGTNWVNTTISGGNGGFNFKGLWDAYNNSPYLNASTFVDGDVYVVSVSGTTDLNGIDNWKEGEMVYRQNGNWAKLPVSPNSSVTSVAGKIGDVLLNTSDITEVSNLYFTEARSRASISSNAPGLLYNSITGVLSLDTDRVIPTVSQISALGKFVNSGSFDETTGILSFLFNDSTEAFTVDLNDRYALLNHSHNYDNYSHWDLQVGSVSKSIATTDLLTITADGTMTVNLNPVTNTVQFTGSAITDVGFTNNTLVFSSIGSSFHGNVDISDIVNYTPSKFTPTTKTVGGIPAGTSYSAINSSTLSGIIDKMLYGDDSGATYTLPELTIIFTKDGSDVTSVPPGTTLDNTYIYSANVSIGNYKNDVGTVQGQYLLGNVSYTYNMYINGILKSTQTSIPATDVVFDLTGEVITASSIIKVDVIVPSRDVPVTLSDGSTITLRLPAQTITNSVTLNAEHPHYHLSVPLVTDIPATGVLFKSVATSVSKLDEISKNLTNNIYMLAVPKDTNLVVYDSGSVQIDYINNGYFVKSTIITTIPDAGGTDVEYDVYVLTNSVPYSNISNFKITII